MYLHMYLHFGKHEAGYNRPFTGFLKKTFYVFLSPQDIITVYSSIPGSLVKKHWRPKSDRFFIYTYWKSIFNF